MNIDITPIDASRYIGGAGTVTGARIRSIDYDANTIRFTLINEDGTERSEVNGITPVDPLTEDTDLGALIEGVIAATLT